MNKKQKKKQDISPTDGAINIVKREKDGVIADPQGSYTGLPADKKEKPVQDADDL